MAIALAGLVATLVTTRLSSSSSSSRPATPHSPGPAPRAGRASRAPVAVSAAAGEAQIRRLAALGLPIYCAGRKGNMVALTFDDGPGPYTRLALRKLRRHGARATFFIVGRNIGLVPGITRVERALGGVGDHSFTHPLLTGLSPAAARSELARTQSLLARSSGAPVTLFRPPYGARNPTVDRLAKQLGMLEVVWTVDSADSLGADYAGISRNVINGLHPGSIILLHENRGQTIRAMLTFLPAIRKRHLQAVGLPELLAADPPTEAQVRAGSHGCGPGVKATGAS